MRASSLTHKFRTVTCLVIVGLFASTTSARSDLLYNGDLSLRRHVESPELWTDADYTFSPNNNFTGAASLPLIPGAQDKLQRYSLSQTLNLAFTAQNSPWSVSGGFQANGTLTLRRP